MSYLEELLPEFRKGAKIRRKSWDNKRYIHLKNHNCCDEDDFPYDLNNKSLIADDWELYQEPIDWDYIIKNKCLCWFWDAGDEETKKVGILAYYDYDNNQFRRYGSDNYTATWFDHCRPVLRDEVTFYEDKKDVAED